MSLANEDSMFIIAGDNLEREDDLAQFAKDTISTVEVSDDFDQHDSLWIPCFTKKILWARQPFSLRMNNND